MRVTCTLPHETSCQAMDEAQRWRDTAVEARREQQRQRFLAGGGQRLEAEGVARRAAEERSTAQALAAEEARQAGEVARRKADERARALQTVQTLQQQVSAVPVGKEGRMRGLSTLMRQSSSGARARICRHGTSRSSGCKGFGSQA
jgi:hypothetical protein